MSEIQNKIINQANEENLRAFTSFDFQSLANYKSISKALETLEDNGVIKRAIRGVYYIPLYNDIFKFEEAPSIESIAEAIARQYNWTIVPTGNYALNILGLSTQVPSMYIYISSGPYNKYDINGNILCFKHTTSRLVSNLPYKLLIAIQALKTLGKDNVTKDVLAKIKDFLTNNDKQIILKNNIKITSWIYDVLRKLCE